MVCFKVQQPSSYHQAYSLFVFGCLVKGVQEKQIQHDAGILQSRITRIMKIAIWIKKFPSEQSAMKLICKIAGISALRCLYEKTSLRMVKLCLI